MAEKYRGALSTSMLLNDVEDLRDFVHYMIDGVEELGLKDGDIPPIVFHEMGKTFNVDYNFLVSRLSDWMNDSLILDDFKLSDKSSSFVLRNGYFLVVSLLENYHEIVRVRQRKFDLSKIKTRGLYEIPDRFYNVLLMKNGENIRQFSAVPFSSSALKKLISDEYYSKLSGLSNSSKLEQIAFGHGKVKSFCEENGIEARYVFE